MPNLGVVIMSFYRATQGGTGKHPRNTMVVPETSTPGYTEAQQTIPPKFARNQLNLLVQNATRNFNTWRAENVLPPADILAATQAMTRGPEASSIEQMCNVPNNLGDGIESFLKRIGKCVMFGSNMCCNLFGKLEILAVLQSNCKRVQGGRTR